MSLQLFQLIFGLCAGLAIALFHRPLADFMLERERALYSFIRSRGLHLPPPPCENTARNFYFVIGIMVALIQVGRLWLVAR